METKALEISFESKEALLQSLMAASEMTIDLRERRMDPDVKFFTVGVDFMQILTMARNLKIAFDKQGFFVDSDSVSSRAINRAGTLRRFVGDLCVRENRTAANGHL